MNTNINVYAQNFKGYKNLIINNIAPGEKTNISLVATELTNDVYPDLWEYNMLKRMKGEPEENVICFLSAKMPSDYLFLNGAKLYSGEELRALPQELTSAKYAEEEAFALKAYTLLARLTRQIVFNPNAEMDNKMLDVFMKAHRCLTELTHSEKLGMELVNSALFRTSHEKQNIAEYVNKTIQKTMNVFFR